MRHNPIISQLLTLCQKVQRMAHGMRALIVACLLFVFVSCAIEPPLHLVDQKDVELELATVIADINVLWDYEIEYDWQAEWIYGWDKTDTDIFGEWNISLPNHFHVRRYFTGDIPGAPHTSVIADYVNSTQYRASYKLGYYDLMVWNDVKTLDGVQSLHFDETTSLDYITAYTNQSMSPTHAPSYLTRPKGVPMNSSYIDGLAFYQPEFLFAGSYDQLHITDNPADYDYIIDNVWYKHVPIDLTPVTYIYLPQIILHNNKKITQIDGSGNLTGLARSVNLKTHISSEDDISVNHIMRMKKGINYVRNENIVEKVDVIGGRTLTFGLTGCNPYALSRASNSYQHIKDSQIKNYLEVKMYFVNGTDSTLVFDVTDQVKQRYKGGVITIHLDCDTVPLPSRSGGSGFDAIVKDFEEVTVPDIPL